MILLWRENKFNPVPDEKEVDYETYEQCISYRPRRMLLGVRHAIMSAGGIYVSACFFFFMLFFLICEKDGGIRRKIGEYICPILNQ